MALNTYVKELAGVLVSVSNTDGTAVNADVEANTEVLWHEWAHAIALKDHLALEEGTLWERGELVGERVAPRYCRFVGVGISVGFAAIAP